MSGRATGPWGSVPEMGLITAIAVGGGLLIAVAVVAITAVVVLRRKAGFTSRAQTAPAAVIGIRRTFRPYLLGGPYVGGALSFSAQVAFTTADGRPVRTEVRLSGPGARPRVGPGAPPLRAGQTIPVRYDPANPVRADVDTARLPAPPPRSRRNARVLLGIYGAVFAVLIAGGLAIVIASLS